jgi:uncharacterized membrane protein
METGTTVQNWTREPRERHRTSGDLDHQWQRHGGGDGAGRRARGLGWFSVGLGLAQLIAPRGVAQMALGVGDRRRGKVMRTAGMRELAVGLGILGRRRPAGFLWARVAGDLMDLAMLSGALRSRRTDKSRVLISTAAVVGVTLLDLKASIDLSRQARTRAPAARATKALTVSATPEAAYQLWRNFERLPTFMANLDWVRVLDGRRSQWKARLPGGKTLEWEAEITDDRPGQLISWRAVDRSPVPLSGTVRFVPAPGGRGTEIHLDMRLDPAGPFGRGIARILAKGMELQVDGDLRRFKQVLETGGVVHSDASIHRGPHPARPPAPEEAPDFIRQRQGGSR